MSNDDYAEIVHGCILGSHPLVIEVRTKIEVLENQIMKFYVTVDHLNREAPTPARAPETFDFSEALNRLKAGKKVRRSRWPFGFAILADAVGRVLWIGDNLRAHENFWIVSLDDFEATDWMELE